jgi:hypothetical protein
VSSATVNNVLVALELILFIFVLVWIAHAQGSFVNSQSLFSLINLRVTLKNNSNFPLKILYLSSS